MTVNCKTMVSKQAEAGLADIIACDSEICFIDGVNGRLVYRGYDALELAEKSTFEEVAYLLWYGCLPREIEFKAFLDGFTGIHGTADGNNHDSQDVSQSWPLPWK